MTVERTLIRPGTTSGEIAVWDDEQHRWEPGDPEAVLYPTGDPGERFRWKVGDTQPTWDAAELINVRDFGAVGDGVIDDTVALAAAFAQSDTSGVPVLIPKGIFLTDTIDWRVQSIVGVSVGQSIIKGKPGQDVLLVNATVGQFYRDNGLLADFTIVVDDSLDVAASFSTRGGVGNAGIACPYNDAAAAIPYPPTLLDWSIERVRFESASYAWGGQNNSCGIYSQSALIAQCAVRSLAFFRLSNAWWDHWPQVNPSGHAYSHDHCTIHQIHFNGCKNNWRMCNWGIAKIDDVILHDAIGGTSWELKGAQSGSNTVGNNHDLHISAVELEGATVAGLVTDASCNNLFLQNMSISNVAAPVVWNANASTIRNLSVNGLTGGLTPGLTVNGHRNDIEINGSSASNTVAYGYDLVSDLGTGNRVTVIERPGASSVYPRQRELASRDGRTLHVRDSVSIQLGHADPLFVAGADLILNPRQFNPVAQAANTYTYVADPTADFGLAFRMLTAGGTFNLDETVVAINGRNGGRIGAYLPPGKVRVYIKCKLATAGTMRSYVQAPINGTIRGQVTLAPIGTNYTIVSYDVDFTGVALDTQFNFRMDTLAGGGATPLDIAWIAFRPWAKDWLTAGPTEGFQDKGGQVFNVRAYGAKGDGVTNDSAAFQAAINAAIAQPGGTVYIPPGSGTYYNLATTITIQPASGPQAWFSIVASTAPTSAGIRWSGPSNSAVFKIKGWKYGRCQGLSVYVSGDNVRVFDIYHDASTVLSSGILVWDGCSVNLGTGRCNVGWRWAQNIGGESSFNDFRNCMVVNGAGDNTTGLIGWQNLDGNHLASTWTNCGGSYLAYLYSGMTETDRLNGAIDAAVTTITLASTLAFPPTGRIRIDTEDIDYTGVSGNQLTGCTRGANATTPASHVNVSVVYLGIQHPGTNGWSYGIIGGCAHTFTGCGGSYNLKDFRSARGTLTVNGGRWEGVTRLFESNNGGSGAMDATFQGVTVAVVTQPADGIIVALAQPGTFCFDNCQFYFSDYDSRMFTAGIWDGGGGPANAGVLAVRNCSIRGASGDTFWTLINSWQVDPTGSYRVNSASQFAQWLDGANGAKVRTVTASTTALLRDDVILVGSAAPACTITLPAAAEKWQMTIKRLAAANAVTVDGNAAETIDGTATKILGSQYAYLTLASDGTAVHIVSQGGTIT